MIHIFRDALLALIPMADRARISWKEPDNYDDWDSIAQSLFYTFVVKSLEYTNEWNNFDEIPGYDIRKSSYAKSSFLSVSTDPTELVFVCFETNSLPFDTAMFARLDVTGGVRQLERQPVNRIQFILSGRSAGSITVIDRINVNS
jgi:hypothetical protein